MNVLVHIHSPQDEGHVDPPKRYENCDAILDQGVLHVMRRTEAPSQYYSGTTYTKVSSVAFYAAGSWTYCVFEEDKAP